MERLPELVLKQIMKKLPRRELEDHIINVNTLWEDLCIEILSEKVIITEFCKEPPGFVDDIDLSITRELIISSGWTCRWWDCEGLTRNYFEDLLRQLSPNYLESLRSPLRNQDQLDIISEMVNLKTLSLDILNPFLTVSIMDKLPRLHKLQDLHLDGLKEFKPRDFLRITENCPMLSAMAFPRRVPWAQKEYLDILIETRIKTIRPWSYIGGFDEYRMEGQSYRLLTDVLESIEGLIVIELHLHHFTQFINDEHRMQERFLPQVAELISRQKSITKFSVFQSGTVDVVDMSVFNLAALLQNMPQLVDLSVNSSLQNYANSTVISIYRSIADLKELTYIMLDEIPINDALKSIFSNKNLKHVTVRLPYSFRQEDLSDLEETIINIGNLPRVENLRLVIRTEVIRCSSALHEEIEARIQSAVTKCVSKLKSGLIRLNLEGGWVNDQLMVGLPVLKSLEALRLVPHYSRIVLRDIEAERLSTPAVLTYAETCCPVIIEPKFLRFRSILHTHYGYTETGDQPGAAYLDAWQSFKRNLGIMSKIERRSALQKLNSVFKSEVQSYHPDWRKYCKE